MLNGVAVAVAATREDIVQRTNALLSELALLWGVTDGDVIVNLFDVPRETAASLGIQLRGPGTATLEVAPSAGPYRTVNVHVRG